MNNDTHLIWEAKQRQAILLENSELVWQALEEAQQALQEAQITPDMVSQINQQIGTNLSIDQLQQIQSITNPGIGKAIGGALGKLGGMIKNVGGKALGAAKDIGGKAVDAAKQQVTDPNSGLRQGLQKAGELGQQGLQKAGELGQQGLQKGTELAKQAGGAVARGVERGADAVGQVAGDVADGMQGGYNSTQTGIKRDPKTGRYIKGNQSGVQFAEQDEEDLVYESVLNRPGWANKKII